MSDEGSTGSRPTDYDKLTDKLGGKMLDFNLKMVGLIATLLVKPLALATDVFFRKDFGERYLAQNSAALALILWGLAPKLALLWGQGLNPLLQLIYDAGLHKIAYWFYRHDCTNAFGFLIGCAYGFMAVRNITQTRRRSASGQIWYSMSRGGSVFGVENQSRDLLLAFGAIVILGLFAPSLGLLFFISRIVSYQVEASQQAAFYNRYLDAMDAKVQAEYLQRALDKGEPPDDTDGLYCPLPKAFKGEYRQRVARVVAGGPFSPGSPGPIPEKPQTRTQFASSQSSRPEPTASVPSQQADLKAAFQDAKATAAETLSQILKSKRIIRFAVIGLILVALVAVGIPVFRFIQSQSSKSAIPPVAVAEQTQPPRANPSTPPPTTPQVQNQTPQSPPVVAPTADASNSAAIAQAALEAKQREEQEKAKQQAALETQRRQEEARKQAALEAEKQQARQKVFDQIKNTLVTESAQVSKFKAECETRLNSNTNKLAKLARTPRKKLTEFNDTALQNFPKALQEQETMLTHFQDLLKQLADNPDSDTRQINDQIKTYIAAAQDTRQKFTATLNDLDIDIANAPKKASLPFLKLN